jgi:hypothetical protein
MQENMRKLQHASGLPNLATLLADLLWLNYSLFMLKWSENKLQSIKSHEKKKSKGNREKIAK